MANNKIVYGDQTLIDLTSDTVTPETLAMGETAHSASGAQIVGTMSPSGPATPLTPSNSDPPSIVDGTAYTANGDGVAIESYSAILPNDSAPLSYIKLTEDSIYKIVNDNGYAVNSLYDITPTDQYAIRVYGYQPVRLTNAGYVISSDPETVQPSSSGTYVTSGMKKVLYSGYLYNHKPWFKTTVLWTNPSTSTSSSTEFAAQDITLSQSITNFDYIGIYWEHAYGSTANTGTSIWSVSDVQGFEKTLSASTSTPDGYFGIYYRNSGSTYYWFLRNLSYNSDTSLHISNCWRMVINTSGTNTKYNSRIIPKYIYGYKVE